MPSLAVIRHAKSDWSHELPDERRPLSPRGRRDAPAVGRWFRSHFGTVDLVVCSTAVRARETLALADLPAGAARYDERLYAADTDDLMSVLDELPDEVDAAALVGHNPGLSELVRVLTGEAVELRTAAIAIVTWEGTWPDVWARRAKLLTHATPSG